MSSKSSRTEHHTNESQHPSYEERLAWNTAETTNFFLFHRDSLAFLSCAEAVMLQDLINKAGMKNPKAKWKEFECSSEEMKKSLHMDRQIQIRVLNKLKNKGLVSVRVNGLPPKRYITVHIVPFYRAMGILPEWDDDERQALQNRSDERQALQNRSDERQALQNRSAHRFKNEAIYNMQLNNLLNNTVGGKLSCQNPQGSGKIEFDLDLVEEPEARNSVRARGKEAPAAPRPPRLRHLAHEGKETHNSELELDEEESDVRQAPPLRGSALPHNRHSNRKLHPASPAFHSNGKHTPSTNNVHLQRAERLKHILLNVRKPPISRTRFNLTKDAEIFARKARCLEKQEEGSSKRIDDLLEWYEENINHKEKRWIPKSLSAGAFCEDFDRMEEARERLEQDATRNSRSGRSAASASTSNPIELSPEEKEVLRDLQQFQWPKGSDQDLPEFVHRSFQELRSFLKRFFALYKPIKDEKSHPLVKNRRMEGFIRFVRGEFYSGIASFVRTWGKETFYDLNGWKEWSGTNLPSYAIDLDPENKCGGKRFHAKGRNWAVKYGDAKHWGDLLKIIEEM